MAAAGAFDAVNMDGGGSATMVVNGTVKNQPSDGSQRSVGNHLAFFASGSGPSPQCPDFVDPICDGDANIQRCEGTEVTRCEEGVPVAQGDCGFFGAGCSTAGGEAHCVHPYCLLNLDGGEDGSFCQDASVGTCALGVFSEANCGAFAGLCSEAGGGDDDAHCVHVLCHSNLNGGEDGTFCRDGATLSTCTLGDYQERTCSEGCAAAGSTAQCGEDADPLPPVGEGEGEGEGGGRAGRDLPSLVSAGCGAAPSALAAIGPLVVLLLTSARQRRPRSLIAG